MDNNNIIKRIEDIAEFKQMSIRKLSLEVGFNYSTLHNYISGRIKTVDPILLAKIILHYSDICPDWLLTGRGEMTIPPTSEVESQNDFKIKYYETIEKLATLQDKHIDIQDKLLIAQQEIHDLRKKLDDIKDQGGGIVVSA